MCRHTVSHGRRIEGGKKLTVWVTSKRHMTAEHRPARAVQTLQADVHSSPASSRLNWLPHRFKWTRPFRWKTKSGFCACAITFQTQSTYSSPLYCTQGSHRCLFLAYTLSVFTSPIFTAPSHFFVSCWNIKCAFLLPGCLSVTWEKQVFTCHAVDSFNGVEWLWTDIWVSLYKVVQIWPGLICM